jgi:hypothetical protein
MAAISNPSELFNNTSHVVTSRWVSPLQTLWAQWGSKSPWPIIGQYRLTILKTPDVLSGKKYWDDKCHTEGLMTSSVGKKQVESLKNLFRPSKCRTVCRVQCSAVQCSAAVGMKIRTWLYKSELDKASLIRIKHVQRLRHFELD